MDFMSLMLMLMLIATLREAWRLLASMTAEVSKLDVQVKAVHWPLLWQTLCGAALDIEGDGGAMDKKWASKFSDVKAAMISENIFQDDKMATGPQAWWVRNVRIICNRILH